MLGGDCKEGGLCLFRKCVVVAAETSDEKLLSGIESFWNKLTKAAAKFYGCNLDQITPEKAADYLADRLQHRDPPF